ncbi:MAG: polysaccharide biosynthesis tyrosine autokinase [Tannerellaceae bacterium]|jgi:capsular exopolysaccharide synthesis family protein|nr:polysaccharide biosynthesis tyrosine autokinase [Tannerellaceae bacterium]
MEKGEDISYRIEEEEGGLSFHDLLQIVRVNWYWFALSVAVCCLAAFIYLQWAPKVYARTATVLIKDDSKGGAASEASAFSELDMFNVKRNVDNELLVFQSKQLMHTVARRLRLDVGYTVRRGLRRVELYSHSPVTVQFPDVEDAQAFLLNVTPLSEKEVRLWGYSASYGAEVKLDETVALNDTVQTAIGRLVVAPTLYYGPAYYHTPVRVTKSDMEQVSGHYSRELLVALANKTATIINLTLQDESIPRAEAVLNTLITVYNEDAVNDKNKIMVNTSEFINERLIIIEQELGNVDTDIETYKRSQGLTDIHSEAGMYLSETSHYSKEELDLQNQRTLVSYVRNYLSDPSRNADLIPANTGLPDSNVEGLIAEYNTALLKRDRLIGNSSERNPVVMDLNNSLVAMKQALVRAVDNLLTGLNVKIRNVQAREEQTIQRISAVPTQQKEVLTIERQQKIKEELYLYLLNKREENALSQAMTESSARIVDPATGSKTPVAPRGSVIMLAALILGLALPAGGLWLIYTMNTTVQNRKDIEDALSIPYLGDIPLRGRKNREELVVRADGRDSITEAFHIVRTNMDFMQAHVKKMKVIMLTSFNPGSGKTFTSSNLALSLAFAGKKTLLIDLDIRKSSLSSQICNTDLPGVTDYLLGKVNNPAHLIQQSRLSDHLDVIPTGPLPPNPVQMLAGERLDAMIRQLAELYNYVILDSAPYSLVADTSIINRVADLTVFVIRAGLMDKRMLPEVEKLYKQNKLKNMSVILNAVDYKRSGYGYGHYGYGAYGYGYGDKA